MSHSTSTPAPLLDWPDRTEQLLCAVEEDGTGHEPGCTSMHALRERELRDQENSDSRADQLEVLVERRFREPEK